MSGLSLDYRKLMDAHCRILIVGAGIGGLALGRALRPKGFGQKSSSVLDRRQVAALAYMSSENGVRALRVLGLTDKELTPAARVTHQRVLDHA